MKIEKVWTDASVAHSTLRERVLAGTERCPLMAATAVWALWTTAEHVSSMARPTTDDNITVYDDAVFCVDDKRCDAEAYHPCLTQPLDC